ncbi:MAG: asparagine synthase B [Thermodesulfobacteriota bacterium]|nr:asparagine synthase B [Thermodesulfobacteriota bacterium]
MCGIAGCFGSQDEKTVNRMLDALTHRGPNDRGIHVNGNMVWGHTRLSIVDVAHGHQPIFNEDKSKGVIANGEIYNFQTIREQLRNQYTFQTHSDSEVILALYDQFGSGCVQDLDGMFAFALFDANRDTFMLARDPIGIKPLYYGYHNGTIYFTSELGAMSLAEVDEVHEFPAGHFYTPEEGFVRYYRLPEVKTKPPVDTKIITGQIRDIFTRAVKKRLLADPQVPVGSFCSGGLDSSIVAAIAAREIPHLHTFVVGMIDEHGNESDDFIAARLAAAHIDSTHHELAFNVDEYYEALHRVIHKLESYDPSLVRCAVPCYFTCKLAAEHVTVVLTGEGADELFAGYHYMKHFPLTGVNEEGRRCLGTLHNINLQRADRMGMYFNLELRVPFLDRELIDLAINIPAELKIKEQKDGSKIEKWIFRQAFADSGLLPDEILWRYKVQYTQGAGCESLGEQLAEKEINEEDVVRLQHDHPGAIINSKEAALYFKIFRQFHPQDSILSSIGIWTGFDFTEEREKVTGTMDGGLKHSTGR